MANAEITGITELLNTVADRPYEQCAAEWKKLLKALRLRLYYALPVQEVLRQGRWKGKANPLGYVRTAAVRTAVRMGLVDVNPPETVEVLASDLSYRDWDGKELDHDEKLGVALYEFEEKYRANHEWPAASDLLATEVLEEGMDGEGMDEVAWERVAELADLDPEERLVLELRMIGFSRPAALEACLREEDRRVLRAAWRRFERHRETIKKVLQSGRPHAAQRLKANAGPEMELMFAETPDNRLKIFFQRVVAENGKPRI